MESWCKSPSSFHAGFRHVFNVEGIFFTTSAQWHKINRTFHPGTSVSVHSLCNFVKIIFTSDNKLEIDVTTKNTVILTSHIRLNSSFPRFSANTKFWGTTPSDFKSVLCCKIVVEIFV